MFAKLWEDIFPLLLSVHRHVSAGKALLQWQSAGNKIKRQEELKEKNPDYHKTIYNSLLLRAVVQAGDISDY